MDGDSDFVNWTDEHSKENILEYQKTRDEKLFSLLLAKYDKYLLKIAWKYYKTCSEADLDDLYHSAIIGFSNALLKFKPKINADLIMPVIKNYVTKEFKARYGHKKLESDRGFKTSGEKAEDFENKMSVEIILNSGIVDSKERELLELKYLQGMTFEEVGKQVGLSEEWTLRKVHKILDKIRGRLQR